MENPMCIYCNQNESEHFLCDVCNTGMCENCYQNMIEHTYHYHEVSESLNQKDYKKMIKKIKYEPAYICEDCLKDIQTKKNIEILYSIYRFYEDERKPQIRKKNLTINQARKHCNNHKTSNKTNTKWLDGFKRQ